MGEIQDGSAVFKIMDERENEMNRKFVDLAYPVGIVVALANDKKPAFMQYGTWEKVAEDRVLQGASDSNAPGKKIEPGLPNITGYVYGGIKDYSYQIQVGGAFSKSSSTAISIPSGEGTKSIGFDFSASKSNSIYGKSETVQPPAYVVAYWQRTA